MLIFRERGRARSRHGSLYRQRLGSGAPVIDIWGLRRGITSIARGNVLIPVRVEASTLRRVGSGLAGGSNFLRAASREARARGPTQGCGFPRHAHVVHLIVINVLIFFVERSMSWVAPGSARAYPATGATWHLSHKYLNLSLSWGLRWGVGFGLAPFFGPAHSFRDGCGQVTAA